MSLKPEAAPLARTLDQLLSCLSLSWSSSRGVSTHCGYLLTSFSVTRIQVSLAPVPVGSGLESAGSIKPLPDRDLICLPAHLPSLLAFCAAVLESPPSKTSCFALACPGPLRSPLPSHLPGKLSSLSSPLRCHLGLRPPRQREPFSLRPHHAFGLYGTSAFMAASLRRCWAHQLQTPPLAQPPEHLINRPRNCFLVLIDLS